MSKVKSLKKALAKVTRSVEKANKSSKGKESKLEEAVKQIEDMSKKPAFVRLRQMANKNRKRKGLPLKPELSDIPEARQKMMTPAQKSRARKARQESGLSSATLLSRRHHFLTGLCDAFDRLIGRLFDSPLTKLLDGFLDALSADESSYYRR